MSAKIDFISAACLLLSLGCLVALAEDSLTSQLARERLGELEKQYKLTMHSLINRIKTTKAADKFSFAKNDNDFKVDIQHLATILENIGIAEAEVAGKTDLTKAAKEGLEQGIERVFDELHDAGGNLWMIPKILEKHRH